MIQVHLTGQDAVDFIAARAKPEPKPEPPRQAPHDPTLALILALSGSAAQATFRTGSQAEVLDSIRELNRLEALAASRLRTIEELRKSFAAAQAERTEKANQLNQKFDAARLERDLLRQQCNDLQLQLDKLKPFLSWIHDDLDN